MNKKPGCPTCKTNKQVVPIQYGYVGVEAWEEEQRGKIKLGGCVIGPEQWHCKRCSKDF